MQMAFSATPMLAFGRSPIIPIIPLSPSSYFALPNISPRFAYPNAVQPRPSHPPVGKQSPEQMIPDAALVQGRVATRFSQRGAVGLRPRARDDGAQDIKVDKNFHFFKDLDGIVPGYDVRTHQPT